MPPKRKKASKKSRPKRVTRTRKPIKRKVPKPKRRVTKKRAIIGRKRPVRHRKRKPLCRARKTKISTRVPFYIPPSYTSPIEPRPPSISPPEEEQEIDQRWFMSTKFSDLIALNKEFVKGLLPMTPYHFGPLETTDKKFIAKLLKLHEYGLLTTNGQDSGCEYGQYVKEGVSDVMGKQAYYFDEERRAYIDFHVDLLENNFLAESLLQQIVNSGLIYTIYNFHTKVTTSNIPKTEKYNLTKGRASLTKETLKETKWDYSTNMSPIFKLEQMLWDEKKIDPILKHTMFFAVALPDYCKGDLESMLIRMCEIADKIGKVEKYRL
jgi:hypothetical protein